MRDSYPAYTPSVEAVQQMEQTLSDFATTLGRIQEILEELWGIPFAATELGLGQEERETWEARLVAELQDITGARLTCMVCGNLMISPGECDCLQVEAAA